MISVGSGSFSSFYLEVDGSKGFKFPQSSKPAQVPQVGWTVFFGVSGGKDPEPGAIYGAF
jgi:hypothetical protein